MTEKPSTQARRTQIPVEVPVLIKNSQAADRNREAFSERRLLVLNVLSSPGSGKTAFIERTLSDNRSKLRAAVIVGDLATDNDAQRLKRSGAPVVQITTGTVCHLEADMVWRAMSEMDLQDIRILVIENVGNLVCPASYDLGETLRVVLLSVTEGEDKPLKYPTMFKTAHVVVVTKMDIAQAVGFDEASALDNIRRTAPQARILQVSARTGEGMELWYEMLKEQADRMGGG
jgi:hydrogenase nickel incorporation protein HypB